jgi:hypothetical protein
VLALAPAPARVADDTFFYAFVSDEIALGHGFSLAHGGLLSPGFRLVPTALHPPLYPLALAGLRELGVMSPGHLLWLGVVTGTVTVIGLGFLGRRLGGATVGLVAATLAAVYPLLIVPDGALLSETLYGVVIVVVLASGLALARRPDKRRAAALGVAVGLATLVRSEAVALTVLIGLPLAWRGTGGAERTLRLAIVVATTIVVIAPWVIRNENVLGATTLSTNDGVTVATSNCATTYRGPDLGYFDPRCTPSTPAGNEAQQSAALRRQGVHYASDHVGRLPVVVVARVARTWGLFHPFQSSSAAGRNDTVSDIGVLVYYPLAILAVLGAWSLRRRRAELWVLIGPFVLVSLVAAVTFGSLRIRYLAELPLILLAAAGTAAAYGRLRSGRQAAAGLTSR